MSHEERIYVERKLRLEWIELGERVARAMGQRKPYTTKTHRWRWRACDACGEQILSGRERPCALTPRCRGTHR